MKFTPDSFSARSIFSVLAFCELLKKQKPAAFHRQRVSKPLGEESF
jgi:uncharacterized membrane protein